MSDDVKTTKDLPNYLRVPADRLCKNLSRVTSLVDLFDFLTDVLRRTHEHLAATSAEPADPDKEPDPTEALRAAVVFIHATLEDFLRSIAQAHLPRTDRNLLGCIPLCTDGNRFPKKCTLADLLPAVGKSVEDVIEESIEHWLSKQSFNHCDDLVIILKRIGIDPSKCDKRFPDLAELMFRRHTIVHNADFANMPDREQLPHVNPLSKSEVETWQAAVQEFAVLVLNELQTVPYGREDR